MLKVKREDFTDLTEDDKFNLDNAFDQYATLYKNIDYNNNVYSAHMLNKTLKQGDYYNGKVNNVSICTMQG